jgi:hypothetical protein
VGPRLTVSLPAWKGSAPAPGEVLFLLEKGKGVVVLRRSRIRRFFGRLLHGLPDGRREDATLRELMDERLRALRVPRVAAVAGPHDPKGVEVTDLLGVLAVVSRTSAGVFLADRDPDLTLAAPGRTVTLVMPEGWDS